MVKRKIRINDYPEYSLPELKWLIENRYLSDQEGYISFNDLNSIMILRELYFNNVINYWKYPESMRKVIDKMEQTNMIYFESSLFSRPEQDYINYFLNMSQFNNGLDLRNKYSHTQPNSGTDESIHENNYMIFLRIFVLTLLKIDDEFCTNKEIKEL